MIGKNKNLVFATFQIMPPCFEVLNNAQKLTIKSFLPCFSKNHFTQELGYQMPLAQVIN